jgi:hypothetical protein
MMRLDYNNNNNNNKSVMARKCGPPSWNMWGLSDLAGIP